MHLSPDFAALIASGFDLFSFFNSFKMNIFVAKLNFKMQDDELQTLFEQFGEVSSAKIITDKMTGRSKGFGFVEMPDDNDANTAIETLNDSDVNGFRIVVKKARPQERSNNSFPRRRYDH